jgi:hypothetical protein
LIAAQPEHWSPSMVERERLAAELRSAGLVYDSIDVRVSLVEDLGIRMQSHLWGGGRLNHSSQGNCMAGFSVIHTSGDTGVATADHCAVNAPTRVYQNTTGGGSLTLNRRGRSFTGNNGDLAWYGGGSHDAPNRFWNTSTTSRNVTATGTRQIGQSICNYGRNSGTKCVTVVDHGWSFGAYHGLTAVDSCVTAGGDSGGPWYIGNIAYGIHSGCLGDNSVFTPVVGNLFQSMNVLVRTM